MRRAAAVIDDVHPLGGRGRRRRGRRWPPTPPRRSSRTRDPPPSSRRSTARRCCGSPARPAGSSRCSRWSGQYVAPGMPVLRIHGGDSGPAHARARRVLVLARQRTIDQDPAFALRMLVDIAIRALSPAVNDPTTAVQALDRLEELLVELHRRDPGPVLVLDDRRRPGRARPGAHVDRLPGARRHRDPPLRRRLGPGLPAPARAPRPPARGGRRARPRPHRARAAAARQGAGRGVPRPGGPGARRQARPPRPRRRRRHPLQVMRPGRRRARLPS